MGRKNIELIQIDGQPYKKCSSCAEVKNIEEFNKNKRTHHGRRHECKICQAKNRRKYLEDNLEEIHSRKRKYYSENAKVVRDYQVRNKDRISQTKREWEEANRNKRIEYQHRRRTNKLNLPNTLTSKQIGVIMDKFDGGCALTGIIDCEIHLDHVIAISKGGGTTQENIVPLKADLNLSKGNSNVFSWFSKNKTRLGLQQERFDKLIKYLADINKMTLDEYKSYTFKFY